MQTVEKLVVPATGFHYDDPSHTYWLDGNEIPGFSHILSDVGVVDLSRIPPDRLEYARQRGSAVHKAAEYLDQGILDWNSVDEELHGRMSAWESFKKNEDVSLDPRFIEQPTYHKIFRYGITPDRFGYVRGQRAIIEIKNTYSVETYWGMQTAAQAHAIKSHNQDLDFDPNTMLRLAVNLKPDGTYNKEVHADSNDFRYFMSCLTVYGLKRKQR